MEVHDIGCRPPVKSPAMLVAKLADELDWTRNSLSALGFKLAA